MRLLNLNPSDFKPVVKDRLFYDRFLYCVSFHLDEISCLRILDHDQINDQIRRRKQWREIAQRRWATMGQNSTTILARRTRDITEKTLADLHVLTDVLLTADADFKLVVSVDQGYVYTSDLDLIEQISALEPLQQIQHSRVEINRPKNTIRLKKSQYDFRSYFKTTNLTQDQKDNLVKFLLNQQSQIRLSPALSEWVNWPHNRTQDYFFVDHHTQNWLTLLALTVPGVIRKTMQII